MDNTINSKLLWNAPKLQLNSLDGVFTFNGWSLDNWNTVRVIWSNHDDIWTVDFNTYNTPLEDGGGVLGKYYRKKLIQLTLSISAWNKEALNDLIDEIKYRTSITEWTLKITINGIVRERTATCTSLKFNRQNFNVNWCGKVVLTFTCVNPHSHLEDPEAENIVSQTGNYQSSVVYNGRAETFPKLYITMDSGSSTWMKFILNWYTIQITNNLTAWDIIVFDGETKRVTLNNTEIAYTWPFTPLSYGENIYAIENSGTYTWTLSYYVKFL